MQPGMIAKWPNANEDGSWHGFHRQRRRSALGQQVEIDRVSVECVSQAYRYPVLVLPNIMLRLRKNEAIR